MYNLLTQPLIRTAPQGTLTLPGVIAALARDEVEGFPALRPHQSPGWHMFLVQLAALALHEAGRQDIPEDEAVWAKLLRGLTPDFTEDEPWRLVVADATQPAFLQPPVPADVTLNKDVPSPDALDLLITAKNHDLKQAVARGGQPEDWLFALVSLQTGEGYGGGGGGYQGLARIKDGHSSRCLLVLAPLPETTGEDIKTMVPRPGAWFRRDVAVLLKARDEQLEKYSHLEYPATGGIKLTWLEPWSEKQQLQIKDLDIWFIEVCRRIRLRQSGESLCARKGLSKATRINAKSLKGVLGDPFAPTHKNDHTSFKLFGKNFDYKTLTELVLSGNWERPLLARPASFEREGDTLLLIAQALARGNCKTKGFKSRILPIGGKVSRALGPRRAELHELERKQMETIKIFDKALGKALALIAAGGDREKVKKDHYAYARDAQDRLDQTADMIFFEYLWKRFEAQEKGKEALQAEEKRFAKALFDKAKQVFKLTRPAIPCASIFRPRAEARAGRVFFGEIKHNFPELFETSKLKENKNVP